MRLFIYSLQLGEPFSLVFPQQVNALWRPAPTLSLSVLTWLPLLPLSIQQLQRSLDVSAVTPRTNVFTTAAVSLQLCLSLTVCPGFSPPNVCLYHCAFTCAPLTEFTRPGLWSSRWPISRLLRGPSSHAPGLCVLRIRASQRLSLSLTVRSLGLRPHNVSTPSVSRTDHLSWTSPRFVSLCITARSLAPPRTDLRTSRSPNVSTPSLIVSVWLPVNPPKTSAHPPVSLPSCQSDHVLRAPTLQSRRFKICSRSLICCSSLFL